MRICDNAFPLVAQAQMSKILEQFKLVLVCGLPLTGKTAFVSGYTHHRNDFTLTHWQRSVILSMLVRGQMAPDHFFGKLQRVEKELFPELVLRDRHQLLVDGWFSTPSSRSHIHNFARRYPTCCLVFDGPDDGIIERFDNGEIESYFGMDRAEFLLYLQQRRERFIWPKHREGWDRIYYVTTFGEPGIQHLLTTTSPRR